MTRSAGTGEAKARASRRPGDSTSTGRTGTGAPRRGSGRFGNAATNPAVPSLSGLAPSLDYHYVHDEPGPVRVVYARQVKEHLKPIARQDHSLIRRTIEEQLRFEPNVRTRNRKPLREFIFDAEWEIRFGPENRFRVFYEVDEECRLVSVLAIGVKVRKRLLVGGREVSP